MSIVVTGATGHLGRLTVEALLARGVEAEQIVAVGRNAARLAELAVRGVTVRRADYTDPASLKEAFVGAERALLISGSEPGQRIPQHRNVVDAAKDAGVDLIAYTSVLRADTTPLLLTADHKATEEYIRESGLPFVLLRNSWYIENYTSQIPAALENGVIIGAAGEGRISGATRGDYAAATTAALTDDAHAGQVFELGGDQDFTMAEYAAVLSDASGKTVVYQDLPTDEYVKTLVGFGLPEAAAEVYADADAGVARGDLFVETGDLSRLIGRPTTSMADAVAAALN